MNADEFDSRYRREVEEVKHRELARANLNSLLMDTITELASSRRFHERHARLADVAIRLGANLRRGARGYGPTPQTINSKSVPLATNVPASDAEHRRSRSVAVAEGSPDVGDRPEAQASLQSDYIWPLLDDINTSPEQNMIGIISDPGLCGCDACERARAGRYDEA